MVGADGRVPRDALERSAGIYELRDIALGRQIRANIVAITGVIVALTEDGLQRTYRNEKTEINHTRAWSAAFELR